MDESALTMIVEAPDFETNVSAPGLVVTMLAGGEEMPQYTTATRPPASAYWVARGLIYVKDPGMPGTYQGCGERSDGGYEWIVVGMASF